MDTGSPIRARLAMFVLSSVVLLVQIAATRLLSATVAYHAAFGVLALVMLALAGSAAAVYRDRSRLVATSGTVDLAPAAVMAVVAGPVIATTGLLYIVVGAIPWPSALYNLMHLLVAGVGLYGCFHTCGYAVAWLLSSWPKDVGRVYFADLLGAAVGCLLAVPLLSRVSPVQLLCAFGALATLAGWLLSQPHRRPRALLVALAVASAGLVATVQPSWVRLRSARMHDQSSVVFEEWNQLARVTVSEVIPGVEEAVAILSQSMPVADASEQLKRWAAGWGMSEHWKGTVPESMWIELDSDAGTQILKGGGTRPLAEFDSLRWDVTSTAHWMKEGKIDHTFVIGGGGGRDFLTALAFGAKHVDVVELNPLVVAAVEDVFPEYSGRPYSREGVSYRIGDARSELSRSRDRYDLIQMSMVDTWAAAATGAMTLSENSLYTREAFRSYLSHLTDDGMFTVSRWYGVEDYAETARVVALMGDALRSAGVESPEEHVAVVYNGKAGRASWVATCIMKRSPLSAAERGALARLVTEKSFGLLWPWVDGVTEKQRFDVGAVLRGEPAALHAEHFDMTPPTDDRPFFFYTGRSSHGGKVPLLFGSILLAIAYVGYLVVYKPLLQVAGGATGGTGGLSALATARWQTVFFAAIGASFMGVELGVLQRYIVFLGHPTYALSVVLFALLLSTALGSLLVGRRPSAVAVTFPALFVLLGLTMFLIPTLLESWHGWALAPRIVAAGLLIIPLGVCMGTALPSGVSSLVAAGDDNLVPWMWAVNGLSGTLASVAGMLFAMELGYTALLAVSALGYAVAWVSLSRFRGEGVPQ